MMDEIQFPEGSLEGKIVKAVGDSLMKAVRLAVFRANEPFPLYFTVDVRWSMSDEAVKELANYIRTSDDVLVRHGLIPLVYEGKDDG